MYVQVRTIDGKQRVTVSISKLTTVKQFKEVVEEEMGVKVVQQRLFFRGKQLEDGYKIFDYDVNVNDVIQLMIKADILSPIGSSTKQEVEPKALNQEESFKEEEEEPGESLYFREGDIVDGKDTVYGAWFEGLITGIIKDPSKKQLTLDKDDDGLLYKVIFYGYPDATPVLLTLKDVRPVSREMIPVESVKSGDTVLINYNIEEPKERGYWYDLRVCEVVVESRKKPYLKGTVFVGTENTELDDCTITFTNEVMKIEQSKLISDMTEEELKLSYTLPHKRRLYAPFCPHCGDNLKRKCKQCACFVCGGKNEPGKQILCDECNMAFHIWCLDPPLSAVPDTDEWYCGDCKNDENEIVKAGGKLKESKKKSKMASASSKTSRDWGKGMACVGRTKECTLVPANHYGPIPGIEVGTCWKFRLQASEAGVHRPHVAGIHGREGEGAYSIVLSGGYEDDIDDGEEFIYTGSGGRDLSGNKRTAEQSSDQTLTRMNRALASNCNAPIDDKKGAESKEWRKGKPVRVIRNFKLSKHSKYAPKEGNRYDGIYKVVKYYAEKGKSGFKVWRFLLRRDDPTPAPWTKEGKKRIESLGLELLYPEGYLDAMEKKEHLAKPEAKSRKRILGESSNYSPDLKVRKIASYVLTEEEELLISEDKINVKLWESAKSCLSSGKKKFLSQIEETFMCICCQELVHKPITTPCVHNICLVCLQRSFTAEVYNCPYCRTELGRGYPMTFNEPLQKALSYFFPGYTAAR